MTVRRTCDAGCDRLANLSTEHPTLAATAGELLAHVDRWSDEVLPAQSAGAWVHHGEFARRIEQLAGEQISPYWVAMEHYDAFLGHPDVQNLDRPSVRLHDEREIWAKRNQALYGALLRWGSICSNLIGRSGAAGDPFGLAFCTSRRRPRARLRIGRGISSAGAVSGTQHDVVDVVGSGGGPGRSGSPLVDLDLPCR